MDNLIFFLGAGENADVSDLEQTTVSPVEPAAVLSQQTNTEAPPKDILLAEQPVWEVEMVVGGQQCPTAASFSPAPSEEEAEDLSRSRDEGEEEEEFEAGAATAPITHKVDKNDDDLVMSQSLSSSQTTIPEQSELFDPQSLHVPEQQNAVEGSQVGGAISPVTALFRTLNLPCSVFFHQLIIITGASYEALASEGIHLNMGGANMEEVTCTVIGGVTSSQICMSDPKRPAEDEDCITSGWH